MTAIAADLDALVHSAEGAFAAAATPAELENAKAQFLGKSGSVTALMRGVRKAIIMDGRVPHSILMELLTDEGAGTMFV